MKKAKQILEIHGFKFYFVKENNDRKVYGIKDGIQTPATPSLSTYHKTDKGFIAEVIKLISSIPAETWTCDMIKRNMKDFGTSITINI